MTLTNTIKYALFITFFAVLWGTTFAVATHRPLAGAIVYWSVGAWGLLVFLMKVLGKKGKGK